VSELQDQILGDATGNQGTETRTVLKTNALESFYYDGNGNLTNWVKGSENWVYEWDWADRLTKVTSNGVVVLQNWYDASSRRIAKSEVIDGQTKKWLYLYDGWDIVAVMNEAGQLRETFTRGVGLAGDIGTVVAVTHHAGSGVTPGAYYTHCNHRGDIALTRSGTATVGSYSYSAFGLQTSAFGPDVCRFKFSSKERELSTSFSYYGYRFYAPQWQRWVSSDKLGMLDAHNLFAFVRNNPICLVDPFGNQAVGFPLLSCLDTNAPPYNFYPYPTNTGPLGNMGSTPMSGNLAVCKPTKNPCNPGQMRTVSVTNASGAVCTVTQRCETLGYVPSYACQGAPTPFNGWRSIGTNCPTNPTNPPVSR
jgi:RHS repeat-associated protein